MRSQAPYVKIPDCGCLMLTAFPIVAKTLCIMIADLRCARRADPQTGTRSCHVMSEIQASLTIASQDDENSLPSNERRNANSFNPSQPETVQRKWNEPAFQDRLLSDRDVAARYQVEKQTIWRWARTSSTFPKSFKIEGTARWSENELDEHDRKLKEARQ